MASRFTDTIQVATAALVSLAAGVVLFTQGTVTIAPNVDPAGGPSQLNFAGDSVSLTESGVEVLHVLNYACSGSGGQSAVGNTNYVFCAVPLPSVIAGSGLLLGNAQLECGDIDVTGQFDTYFGKSEFGETSSGTTTIAVNGAITGTGNAMSTNTGAWVWNGADYLRIIPKNLSPIAFGVSTSDCRVRDVQSMFSGKRR